MEKKKLILLCILLCGCSRQRSYACIRDLGKDQIRVDLTAKGDVLLSLHIIERYGLPYNLLPDEKRLEGLDDQLEEGCFYEGNDLICECTVTPERTYSLEKSLERLKDENYVCE